jgi:hypothetical protein
MIYDDDASDDDDAVRADSINDVTFPAQLRRVGELRRVRVLSGVERATMRGRCCVSHYVCVRERLNE